MKTIRLRVSGHVQGVWYRAWTQETAESLGLNGWVRNRNDGSVEALVSGEEDAVAQLIEKCWEGSTASRVDNITFEEVDDAVELGFKQEQTIQL